MTIRRKVKMPICDQKSKRCLLTSTRICLLSITATLTACSGSIPGLVRYERDCTTSAYANSSLQPKDQTIGTVQRYRTSNGGIKEFSATQFPTYTPTSAFERFADSSGLTANDVDCITTTEQEFIDVATGFKFNSRAAVIEGYKGEPIADQNIDYEILLYLSDSQIIDGSFRIEHKLVPNFYEKLPELRIGDKVFSNVVIATNYLVDESEIFASSLTGENTIVPDDAIVDEIIIVRDYGLMQYTLRNGDVYTRLDAFNN